MKKTARKTAVKSEDTEPEIKPGDKLDELETLILAGLEKIHQLEKENAELLYQLQEKKYQPLQAQDQLEKKLNDRELMIRRQQTMIQAKEQALQSLHADYTQLQKEHKTITEHNQQLNRENQELKNSIRNVPAKTESSARNLQTEQQVRARIEQAVEKVEQLERLFIQP